MNVEKNQTLLSTTYVSLAVLRPYRLDVMTEHIRVCQLHMC